MNRFFSSLIVFALAAWTLPARAQDNYSVSQQEAYPEEIQARLEVVNREISRLLPSNLDQYAPQYVITNITRWSPGQVVRVAFNGGSYQLRKDIADTAQQWTDGGNLKLDFGHDPATQTFRQWTYNDKTFVADIRIGFEQSGYWSLVGTDSSNPVIVSPNEASMNLGGFHLRLPAEWKGTVLHEFGHALGFQHEHQHPLEGCDSQFRWYNDAGYILTKDSYGQFVSDSNGKRPGLYTVLAGRPNEWSESKVDRNLRQLKDSRAYDLSSFDPRSIMKYEFPAWMFVNGAQSTCFSESRNSSLSPQDRNGFARAYPRQASQIGALVARRSQFIREIVAEPNASDTSAAYLMNQTLLYKNSDLRGVGDMVADPKLQEQQKKLLNEML
ncbi:MAG TPA: hypothetical protein VF471_06100 [Pseudoxanthomonas sp.]